MSRSPLWPIFPAEADPGRCTAAPIPSSPKAVDSDREDALIRQIRDRTENLFRTRQHDCAEAILLVLNRAFQGGLSEHHAVALTSGLPNGLGGSGCTCGALSGAVLALGLLVGGDRPHRNRSRVRRASALLHDRFKAAHGSTCCRVLTRKGEKSGQARFDRCGVFTGDGAEMAARLALEFRPELARTADPVAAEKRDSRLVGFLLRVGRLVR